MLVTQLIQILEKLPPHLEVFIDVSPSLSEYWVLGEVGGADEIQIEEQGKPIVLISRHDLPNLTSEPNLSDFN